MFIMYKILNDINSIKNDRDINWYQLEFQGCDRTGKVPF